MSNVSNSLYEFAGRRFDGENGKLWRDDELILLSPKSADLLKFLLDNNGEYVSKDQIFARVWAETFVEDGVLTQNIYTLRKSLGAAPDGKSLIENKARLGYRITVPVVKIADSQSDPVDAETTFVTTVADQKPRRRWLLKASLAVFAVLLVAAALIGWRFFRPQIASVFRKRIDSVKFLAATKSGDIAHVALSPDGNFIATVRGNDVFLGDLSNSSEVKLTVPGVESFSSPVFSPDGLTLYLRNHKVFNTLARIFRVPRFGGNAEFLVDNSWGNFALSPDGNRLAYFRNVANTGRMELVITNTTSKQEERAFPATEAPNFICTNCSPSWSPDGRKILFTTVTPASLNQLWIVDTDRATVEEFKLPRFRRFEQATWFPDGESFLLSASDGGGFFHLWKVYYPIGDAQPLSNGLVSYGKMSISADGRKIVAQQTFTASNIFVVDVAEPTKQKQITTGNQNTFGQSALNWIDENRLVMSVLDEKMPVDNLAILDVNSGAQRVLSNETRFPLRTPTSDGKFIYFNKLVGRFSHIFQMSLDGSNVKQLTSVDDGQRQSPRVTADGRYVYYSWRSVDQSNVRRFDVATGREDVVFSNPSFPVAPYLELSPDGRFVTFYNIGAKRGDDATKDKFNAQACIVSLEKPNEIKTFLVSAILPTRRFSPDGNYIDWISADSDGTEIVRGSDNASEPTVVFSDRDGYIFNFAWSRSGKLAVSRGRLTRDAVLLTDFDK